MSTGAQSVIFFVVAAAVFAQILFAFLRIRSAEVHERGHLALSTFPSLYLLVFYLFAFYVRIGFGSWPRSCLDNPDLPLVDLSVFFALALFVVLFFLPPVWLTWLIIRLIKGPRRRWLAAVILFSSGIATLIASLTLDPWGFWSWVWD
jgi:hypothetical protein